MRGALNDVGDPEAPVGSPEWCKYAHVGLCQNKQRSESAVSTLKWGLRSFRKAQRHKQLSGKDGKPFKSWKAYVTHPEPWGLGMRYDIAEAVMNEEDEKALLGDVVRAVELGPRGRPRKGEEKADDIRLKKNEHGSTSRKAILARLDRDGHAELAAAVRAKTISAHAAALQVGYRRQLSVLDQMLKLWTKATSRERAAFKREIV